MEHEEFRKGGLELTRNEHDNASKVVEIRTGSSTDGMGQPKVHKDPRRKFDEDMHDLIKQQRQYLCKRRRIDSTFDSDPNSESCKAHSELNLFKGNLQRDQADIRKGIQGSICKREANAILNIINAKCDESHKKKLKQN